MNSHANDLGDPCAEVSSHTESDLLSEVRQLIWVGRRSGEGYFRPDGRWMVFQAEREADNPFYQIYLLDRTSGAIERVSPGFGKTTCAWIHPSGQKVLFASTHHDPEARAKMRAELDRRARGQTEGGAAWDYDPEYDLYECWIGGAELRRLTDWPGYTAEASWSPDGSMILCASNRRGYEGGLSAEEAARFAADPSYLIDIYLLASDGSWERRLTDGPGYDGGPFFRPDGQQIVWRRFDAAGRQAEIWTMNLDGSDQRPITRLGAMSWAPFYHPSGDYIIFTSNRHGFANFELYIVDSQGLGDPVRVTFTDGPDVLPVFTPDGEELVWVTRRTDGRPHLHIARWNDAVARQLLGLPRRESAVARAAACPPAGLPAAPTAKKATRARQTPDQPEIAYVRRIVERLASPEMAGRLTGSEGERRATSYVAKELAALGLIPAGEDGYFQTFEFTSDVHLEGENRLVVASPDGARRQAELNHEWRPLAFARPGGQDFAAVTFVGYGLVAPAEGDQAAYDAYGDLDVRGQWVMMLRYVPEDVDPVRRQYLSRFASLRYKAMEARDRGAVGMIVVTGPRSPVREELVPLQFDGTVAGASIAALSVTNALAAQWLGLAGHDLEAVQAALDSGDARPGFVLPELRVGARIGLGFATATGRNVLAILPAAQPTGLASVAVGAHVDHLGHGERGNSLARSEEQGQLHPGADDNASGVAGLLLMARRLAARRAAGELGTLRRDVLFAVWTGEELGLLGSTHYAKQREAHVGRLSDGVAAYVNLDMIGRLERTLTLQGIASSPEWIGEIERANVVCGLPLSLSDDTYLPTDATAFYTRGVPVLAAFTGTYCEHHSPRDRPELLRYDGLVRIGHLIERLLVRLAQRDTPLAYARVDDAPRGTARRSSRVYLGTIPDFSVTSGSGVLLGGVAHGGPAEQAGLQVGDRVVALAGQPIGDIYEYMRTMDALKIGQPVAIAVERDGQRLDLTIVPGSRE